MLITYCCLLHTYYTLLTLPDRTADAKSSPATRSCQLDSHSHEINVSDAKMLLLQPYSDCSPHANIKEKQQMFLRLKLHSPHHLFS